MAVFRSRWALYERQRRRIFVPSAGTTAQNLTATKFTNTSTFGSHALSVGAVTLTPTKFTNSSTFGTHTVSVGSVTLTPTKFTNSSIFGSHTLSVGATTLTPSKFTNTSTFGSHSISVGAVTLTPTKFTNTSTFGSHVLVQEGGAQTLIPTKFTNTSVFGTHAVTTGVVTLTPTKFTNTSTFGSHSIGIFTNLSPTKFSNTSTFGDHVVSVGTVTLVVTKFTNTSIFGTHTLTGGEVTAQTVGSGGGIRIVPLNHDYTFMVKMLSDTDHATGMPGLTLSFTASKNGAAFASITPTVVDRGQGWYAVTISGTDLDTEGDFVMTIEATGADDQAVISQVAISTVDALVAARLLTLGQFLALK